MVGKQQFVTVFTDASHCPDTWAYGWSLWVKFGEPAETRRASGGGYGLANSTEAELRALENAVRALFYYEVELEGVVVVLQSDSTGALDRLDTQRLYEAGVKYVKKKHVKGHQGHKCKRSSVNTWCDRAARNKMRYHREVARGGSA